ncbi:type II secretion system minor pseudopilin GspI [Pseudomonas sp. TMW22090]|uniref:type II secretion system minor pseudopilin GspI n=1 Tax=Pseudomonas sp. TMW22090 TaxID=2506434 RepID=UPI001F104517|nr:type II secretion system minor pseudopilin GspI [Pseudomonas sp. TMW22090]
MNLSSERGFTLLEVMVALAIFATASIALYSAVQHITRNSAGLSERTQALWIADNRLNELRAGMLAPGKERQEQRVAFGGREWWLLTDSEPAPDSRLLKVSVRVSPQASLDDARQYSRAHLVGFIEAQP